ncbi:hypothetical protein [Taibaiella chishuiensis]|uniref:Uncharacterized protein n=1 Tax=Taibaiella chishuiensis TaxID=1434707 RepID=A0A2P8CV24_9BACT|nr:hypothetical protein [Taibaiella chishuiensis]PSK88808.1 hypothetical protein B0I18_11419 [Taibaiella chishuiensis]
MFLTLCSALSALLSFIAGTKSKGVLWIYMLCCCLYNSLLLVLQAWTGNEELWTRNGYLALEFTCIVVYYEKEVFVKKTSFQLLSAALLVVFLAGTTLAREGWLLFYYTGACILNFYYILLSLAGYRMLLREQKNSFLEKSSFFWANTALGMYAAGSLLLCLLHNLGGYPATPGMAIYAFLSLDILKNILTGIALTRKPGY